MSSYQVAQFTQQSEQVTANPVELEILRLLICYNLGPDKLTLDPDFTYLFPREQHSSTLKQSE